MDPNFEQKQTKGAKRLGGASAVRLIGHPHASKPPLGSAKSFPLFVPFAAFCSNGSGLARTC
jgi:hypothetical protein